MTTKPLYAWSHGPPPTCPFIQPTMRKSDITLVPVNNGETRVTNFSKPEANPLVRLGAGSGLWAVSLFPSTVFLNFFGQNQVRSKIPAPSGRRVNLAFTVAWSASPTFRGNWPPGRTEPPVAGSGYLGGGRRLGNRFLHFSPKNCPAAGDAHDSVVDRALHGRFRPAQYSP